MEKYNEICLLRAFLENGRKLDKYSRGKFDKGVNFEISGVRFRTGDGE